ncbi:MAG: class I SAM-dependent methyltransferase [Desulfobulbaceae bacterium]|uniref:Class I SAM-dependent methyltransferase n=1 Tax=Candidatus Desulfatifera sulfidica TaxID=2841691 RepID=A0A8J6NAM5_9BACT|nr:class I SAM-dependent methyltransferase [Candidatus Desulfatifera sulfidica]
MKYAHSTSWKQHSQVFDERAAEYDSWFDDSLLFEIELSAIQSLTPSNWEPALEIGVGPGRFAQEMNTTFGLDPAKAPLELSRQRGIAVCQGQAEALPLQSNTLQGIAILFTLCFLENPQLTLKECARVLKPGGHLLIGIVPARSVWGQALNKKKEADHPFYRTANFLSIAELMPMLENAGLSVVQNCSTLFQKPKQVTEPETARPGLNEQAGFVVILCQPTPQY